MKINKELLIIVLLTLSILLPNCAEGSTCYTLQFVASSYTGYRTTYTTEYYTKSCGWFGWRRCRRSRQRSVQSSYTYYLSIPKAVAVCCDGYSGTPPNCLPVCADRLGHCASCVSPGICTCDAGWSGNDCDNDVNECSTYNGGCEYTCTNNVGSYSCSCPTGFSVSSFTGCQDNNECASNNGGCDDICHNTPGSYSCSCHPGYTGSSTCTDINECTANTDPCTQVCVNTPGSYYCRCNNGYVLASNGFTCNDERECDTNNGGCEYSCSNTVGSYVCSCNTGYQLATNQHSCNDVNECSANTDGCSQNCHNTHGSFYCSCNNGYSLSSNRKGCNDVNECNSNNGGCEHSCTNSVGSFSCSCNTGYSLQSGRHCEDNNECNSNNGNCAHTCYNTVGSYSCQCNTGYALQSNGRSCSDINECSSSNGGCAQTCVNTPGSYYCTCNTGYVLAGNGRTCNDNNECGSNNGGCDQVCQNTAGSYSCSCNTGYTIASNGRDCNDNNECSTNNGGCEDNCINTVGSYYCTCDTGYSLDSDQRGCTNINECNQGNGGCEHTCADNGGSFTCSCRTGYELSYTKHCSDINECNSGNSGCQHTCVNTVGSYICQCNDGYTLDSNGRTCTDINECSTDNGGCDHTCTNTAGSFRCSCNTGYTLDLDDSGCSPVCANACHHCTSCDSPSSCTCDTGFTGSDCCQDINECTTNNGGCAQNCINYDGSYLCTCNSGYTLHSNGHNCIDNNECASDSTNECNQRCTNTAGSYVCYCNAGYELDSDDTTCVDTNECNNATNGGCNQTCTNTVPGYTCSCRAGYTLDSDNHGCNDVNECTAGTDDCDHNCYNTIGSYTCNCNTGYELDTNGVDCVDKDECATDNGGCNQTCHNDVASFHCTCLSGYVLEEDGLGCADHDECATNSHACDQHCHNSHNSYYCTCDNGYRLSTNGRSCIDIDECAEHSSGCNQICNNTDGSRICSCFNGFELSSNNRTCLDINECNTANGGCDHNCTNSDGTYTCSCIDRYELDNDEHHCNDINECERNIDLCEHTCTNTVGSYDCSCNTGYFLDTNSYNCSDVNECDTNNGGCNQTCVNEEGSFHCLCRAGFTLNDDGFGCTDINECTEHTDGCGQLCNNTIGSFYCDCYTGYRLNNTNSKTCHDINECTEDTDGCAHQCNNTIGSYYCFCNTGYRLDSDQHNCSDINECSTNNGGCAQNCSNNIGSYQCSCIIGYTLAVDEHNCNDINECSNGDSQCEQECINNIGSYSCNCFTGYQLKPDGYNCTDINECNSNNGGCEHNCTNGIGSFECSCLAGYYLEADRLGCMDIDECSINVDGCEQNCHNTNGSYYCSCNDGYRLNLMDTLTCDDINECLEGISGCEHNCTNTIGSYNCSCVDGYYLDFDHHSCPDVNECELDNGGCEHNCNNQIGSFYCSCRNGYDLDPDSFGCTGQPCFQYLTAPVNGSMNCTGIPDQVTDEHCTFWCDYGFTFYGSSLRTCQSDHSWTGIEPYCVIKHCPVLLPPPNAYIATKPCDTSYSNKCEVDCVDGYHIEGVMGNYYQTCSVNTTNNEVYWSIPPVCELIPSCLSSPCLHNGTCTDVNIVNYRCDCSHTNYKGRVCEVGILSTPAVPVLITHQTSEFLHISAYPEVELRVEIVTSSEDLVVRPSVFYFYTAIPTSYFKLEAHNEGVYTLSYNLSGINADNFETPPPVRVIAVNNNIPSLSSSNIPTVLTPGCCSPGGLTHQCPYSTNVVHFTSTCSWQSHDDGVSQVTDGIVFASSNGLVLPVSIAGTHLTDILTDDISNTLPVSEYSCSDCRSVNLSSCVINNSTNNVSHCKHNTDSSCTYYSLSASEIINMLAKRTLHNSYLSYVDSLLPRWLSLYVDPFNLSLSSHFTFNDYSTLVTTGRSIANFEECRELELDPDGLYSIIRFSKLIQVEVMNDEHVYSPQDNEELCIAIDLCQGRQSPVHINLPNSSLNVVRNFRQIELLISDGWELSFYEATLSRNGSNFDARNISLPDTYWDGHNFIDSSSLVPSFDVRLKMSAYKPYDNNASMLWSSFNITGYLYYMTQPVHNKIDGLINGTLYVTFNTTIGNTPAAMMLTTRTNPALFSIFNTPNSTFNGIAMKLDYMPLDESDEFFSKVFKCSSSQSCPSDIFVNLTSERKIDSISIHNTHSTLSIAGYEFPRGSLQHFLSLSAANIDPPLSVLSNLTGKQLILNPYLSLRQPDKGPAVNASYWRNGRVNAKLPKVAYSILQTTFLTSLSLNDDSSLSFESDINLLGDSYTAHITGHSPPGNTWDNFTLNINGSFNSKPDSFVTTLEQYVYNYTTIKVNQTQERIKNVQSEIFRLEALMEQLNNTLAEKQSNRSHLSDLYLDSLNAVAMSSSAVDQAQNLLDTANASVLAAIRNIESVCMSLNCPDMCVPSVSCKSCDNHMTLNEWGTRNTVHMEKLLQHKQEMTTKKKWHFERLCRIITKIRAWGETTFGQICSYRAVFSNVTYETGVTYYDTVNISHTEATVVDSHEYVINQTCCNELPCGFEIVDYECTLSNVACQIAQSPAYDALNQAQRALLEPLFQLSEAKLNLSIAKTQLASNVAELNANEIEYNQTRSILQTLQNLYKSALNNLALLQEDQSPILTISQHLNDHSIQQLLNLNSISFTVTITESSPSYLPVTISCIVPAFDSSFTITAPVHLSATLPLLQRDLADLILTKLGTHLEEVVGSNKQKRAINFVVQPSFNKREFEMKCTSLHNIENSLIQLNNSIHLTAIKSQEAKTNITDTAAKLGDLINVDSLNFTHINYSYLQSQFSNTVNDTILLSQATMNPTVMNLTSSINSLRQTILSFVNSLNVFLSWQVSTAKLYNDEIDSVANLSCFGLTDCLTVTGHVLHDLITDTPTDVVNHNMLLSALSIAKLSLLQLSLSNNLTLSEAFFHINIVYSVVSQLEQANYWCSGLPIITEHPISVLYIELGTTLSLNCSAYSVQSIRYGWRKDGFALLSNSHSSVLVINNTTPLDEGQYQCTASNAIGTVESHLADVYIVIPPVITLSPTNYSTFVGSDNGGWFACNATGHPTPAFRWLYSSNNTVPWLTVRGSGSNELHLQKPTLNQEGWYKCIATIGDIQISSNSAYLTVYSATISTINFPTDFVMFITKPPNVTNSYTIMLERNLVTELKNEVQNDNINIDDLYLLFGYGNTTVLTNATFYSGYNYSLIELISDQAISALPYKTNLIRSVIDFEERALFHNVLFDIENSLYVLIGVTLNIHDLQYRCPVGKGVESGNFICVDCIPGTYPVMIDSSSLCVPCEKGTYGTDRAQNECHTCPQNTSTLSFGAMSLNDCIDLCPPGMNSTNGFQPNCAPCPSFTYTLEYGSIVCNLCDNSSSQLIPECFIPEPYPSSSSVIIDKTPSTSEEESFPNLPYIITGTVIFGVLLGILFVVVLVTIGITYRRRKKKPAVVIHRTRAARSKQPEAEFSVFANPLFVESKTFEKTNSENFDDFGEIQKSNPLYMQFEDDDEGTEYDSISSLRPVGQFFPHHPPLENSNDPQYDVIEPIKLKFHKHHQDDNDKELEEFFENDYGDDTTKLFN